MTTRVDPTEVQRVIKTKLDDSDIYEHIQVANRLVTDLLVGKGMSADRLRDVELYLAAHFISMKDQDAGQTVSKSAGETEATYGGNLSEALSHTRYGQQALILDTSGTLTSVGMTRAQFRVF